MDPVLECCAGLDVHQETVVACVLSGPLDRKPEKEIRTFGTTTAELLGLCEWLEQQRCTHVAMESTGVLWKPVWNVLESADSFTLVLANARRIKNVPGRKTDVKDAEWIASLLRCGLIEGSFVPPEDIRELRDMTRYRKKLVENATAEKNRIHKTLQDANIKLTTYVTDIFGIFGRCILTILMNGGVIDVDTISRLATGKLRHKIQLIVEACNGRIRHHHREMLRMHWDHLLYLEKAIAEVESRINELLEPYRKEVELLESIPGVKADTIAVVIAEMGVDMSVFPTDSQAASWAGLCPGNNESAGKKNGLERRKETAY